ncbi:MAG: aminotransferase class V-fold PLP-dependent enzyme [Actinomycetota bacterium]
MVNPDREISLNHGMETVAIPGPSIIPQRVLNAFSRPMPDIYAGNLLDVSDRIFERLPAIARTSGEPFVIISNGHGAWQMAVSNTLSRGDKVLVLESGRFAIVWGELAEVSGVKMEILPGSDTRPVDPDALRARLADDPGHEIKAVLSVHTDTATSVRNDIPALRAAIDAAGHPALFMVDCIASMGCEPYEMDEWGVDITIAAAQKGMMVPPGLAFLWANEKALAAYDSSDLHVGYLNWGSRRNPEAIYQRYSGTPPVSHLFALDEALTMMDEEGLEARWDRHRALAGAVWAAVDAWSTPDGIGFNIAEPENRSTAVTTVRTGSIDAEEIRRRCAEGANVTLGLGIGDLSTGGGFRIGHMGYLNPPMLLGTLGTIEAALAAMGAPMGGSGVGAAAASLGSYL